MNQRFLVISLSFFSLLACFHASLIARSVHEIELFYKDILISFERDFIEQNSADNELVQKFLMLVHDHSDNILKQVQQDIKGLKKEISSKRKKVESLDLERSLKDSLTKFLKFLRKHRLQLDIINYHALVKKEWGDLFAAVDIGQDILPLLPAKGIDLPGVKGLRVLAHRIDRIKGKIEEYEYRLHTDWIDLKLANYVLRIETIRLRNAAIFHPLYRGTSCQTAYPR